MTNWAEGYVTDVAYTHGYYPELNPLRTQLALLNNGVAPGEIGTACELGFGQGVSTNIHAAASPVQWWGTDFNPTQAAGAQAMAAAAGAGARLYDDAFADFCHRGDLPDFDFIGLHGIWTWVSDDNRRLLVDFIRRKLKVGGVVYMSYNTLAGWTGMVPVRHLLIEHGQLMTAAAEGTVARVDSAIAFAKRLMATNPGYAKANPAIQERLAKLSGFGSNYLAHEYFNESWQPMPFATVARYIEPAKLGYVCSANFLEQMDVLNLSAEQMAFLKEVPHPLFRETVRDLMVNQSFRRDYWVKGPRKLNAFDQSEQLKAQWIVLAQHPGEISRKVSAGIGEASLQEEVYGPILEVMNKQPLITVEQLVRAVSGRNLNISQVVQAIIVLCGSGAVMPAQSPAVIDKVKAATARLNKYFVERSRGVGEIGHMASPVTGGGIMVDHIRRLFLLAREHGHNTPDAWARFAWAIISAQAGKIPNKDGALLQTPEDNMAELERRADEFAATQFPLLKMLGVID